MRRNLRALRAELKAWGAERRRGGIRHATNARLRATIGLEDLEDLRSQIEAGRAVATARFERLESSVRELGAAFAEGRRATARAAEEQSERTRLVETIDTVTTWVAQAAIDHGPLISVVFPTRSMRAPWLRRAITSVLEQAYTDWELLVVGDGPEECRLIGAELQPFLHDTRVRIVESDGTGVSRARNVALNEARGAWVTYHDDDNAMGPCWLKSIAWAASRWPEEEVFYGARIIEEALEYGGPNAPDVPWLQLEPFDYRRLTRGNYIDQCVVAHRSDLLEARFDETLPGNVDWELWLRLFRDRVPRILPIVACYYGTTATGRITGASSTHEAWTRVHERARDLRPLRVLAFSYHYPVVEMSYVHEDIEALARSGAEVIVCSEHSRPASFPIAHPFSPHLEDAVRDFEPDMVLVHWATLAFQELDRLRSLSVPFAVRTHSFPEDVDPAMLARLAASPNCIGVWAFPHVAATAPGVHPLPALFDAGQLPPRAERPDLVLMSCAGLPKKDFAFVLDAIGPLAGVERRIAIGTTREHEQLPSEVVLRAAQYPDPPLVQMNLTHDQVHHLMARTAVLLYTLPPEHPFGSPMSVVGALTAGASVILPDRPEAREMAGDQWFRGYRSGADIRAHVHEVMAGGPVIAMEQAANREQALRQFCDPEHAKRFYAELRSAVDAWSPIRN